MTNELIKPGVRSLAPVGRHLVDARLHRLQWNENPFDFPQDLKEEVLQRLAQAEWSRYPRGARPWPLIERLAQHYGVAGEQIVVSEGSADLIKVLMASLIYPGDGVVMPSPTFLLYRQNAAMHQATVVEVPLDPQTGWALPVEESIEASHRVDARLNVLCAPNNPTGTRYAMEALRRMAMGCRGLLLVDEAYAEFCDQDLTPLLALGNVVLLRTFSKVYAMAGVRVGYLLTSPALATEFQKAVTVFPLSIFSEIVAEVALDHHDRFLALRDAIVVERERVAAALAAIPGLQVFPSSTNFLLVQLHGPKAPLLEFLHRHHSVLISDMAAYPELTDCVRISIGSPAQNDLVVRGFRAHFSTPDNEGDTART